MKRLIFYILTIARFLQTFRRNVCIISPWDLVSYLSSEPYQQFSLRYLRQNKINEFVFKKANRKS